jgi:drug/metabolite transporter (DMT)-like permease
MTNNLMGISLAIFSMLCFAIVYAFYKACEPFLSSGQVICFSNFCSWIFILPFALKNGCKGLTSSRLPMIVLRTLLGAGSLYCIARAVGTVSLSEVTLLNNTAPLFIPFIVWIWHKTKIPHQLWPGLIIGFIGIFIVLRPGIHEISPGFIFGLISGITTGAMLVAVRQIAHESFLKIMFYYFLILWLVASPFLFTPWSSPPLKIWLYLALAGLSMIGAQISLTVAMRSTSPHDIAPLVYISVIFAGLIDWIIWDNKPGLIAILGIIVVIVGGIMTIFKGQKTR